MIPHIVADTCCEGSWTKNGLHALCDAEQRLSLPHAQAGGADTHGAWEAPALATSLMASPDPRYCALRRVALRAYGAWAAWAARALGGQLGEALRSDAALTSPHPLRGWEETVVAQARLQRERQPLTAVPVQLPGVYQIVKQIQHSDSLTGLAARITLAGASALLASQVWHVQHHCVIALLRDPAKGFTGGRAGRRGGGDALCAAGGALAGRAAVPAGGRT